MCQTLLLTSLLSAASSTLAIPILNDSISPLIITTSTVLLQAFQDPFGSVHIAQRSTSTNSSQLHAELLDGVIAQLDGQIVIRFNAAPGEVSRRPRFFNLFLVDTYEAFVKLWEMLTVDKYDFSGRYLVVFSSGIDEGSLRRIFNDLWKLQIVNVVVVCSVGAEVQLWTYYAFSSRACRMVRLERITRNVERELYPDKTTSFHGCEMKVGAFETRPYTIMHRTLAGKPEMGGFEGDVLDVLKEKLNFKTVIYEPPNGQQWGYPSERNSTGMMRMIQEEEVDFGMSCLGISVARSMILKAGIAHHTTLMVIAVPKGRPYTPIEKMVRPFSTRVWLFIGIVLLAAFTAIGVIEFRTKAVREFVYGRGVKTPRLNLIQVFFGLGLPRIPSRNFARTCLFLWIFYCFVLRSLYQGAMFQHLQQNSNLPPSKTLNEIDQTTALYYVVESGERYYEAFPERYQRYSARSLVDTITNFLLSRVRHLPQEHNNIIRRLDWMELHPESSDVVQGTLDHMAHHNMLHRRKGLEPVPICRETLATFTIAIYYPKKSMLTKQFDRQLQRIQAAGLMNYWVKQYGDYEFFGRSKGGAEPRQLSNEHLMVAYELYGVLVILSGLVFGLELISNWVEKLRWMLLELAGH